MTRLSETQCSVDGCNKPKGSTKYCHMHYWRISHHGSVGQPGTINEQHGMKRNPTYEIWVGMRQRCNNTKSKAYIRYGARGISVTPRWDRFSVFYKDMGERPSKHHSIDRIDMNGNYDPSNCRWALASGQAANRKQHENKYGYKGIGHQYHRWYAVVTWQGKQFYAPPCDTAEESAWMYDQWALAIQKEFAVTNFKYI